MLDAEKSVGGGRKSLENFTLGQLVNRLKGANFLDEWSRATDSDVRGVQMINLEAMTALRNRAFHNDEDLTKGEADFLFYCAQSIVETFHLLPGPEERGHTIDGRATAGHPGQRRQRSRFVDARGFALRPRTRWRILPSGTTGRSVGGLDRELIGKALDRLSTQKDLVALDLGCAGGRLTIDRLNDLSEVSVVLGVDKNEQAVERARAVAPNERFVFEALDIEAPDFETNVQALIPESQRGIDIALAVMTLHHLATPIRVLRALRMLLADHGVIVVRTVDDGLALAFPDETQQASTNLLRCVLAYQALGTAFTAGRSHTGLYRAGFRDISVHYRPAATAGRNEEERRVLFRVMGGHRRASLQEAIDGAVTQGDAGGSARYKAMLASLEEIELDFEDPGFFFCLFAIGGVAFQPSRLT